MPAALAMMRQPARLAGLTGLQDFLERGFAAFRSMGGAEEFLRTIESRETQIMEAIVGGAHALSASLAPSANAGALAVAYARIVAIGLPA